MSNVIKIAVAIANVADRMHTLERTRLVFENAGAKDFDYFDRREKARARQMSMLVYAMGLEFTPTPARQ